ncbi:MAG TPA: aminotransferase class V-fold PLP-dependent enzyme [Bryobacteraceae bacterium]|nr:aminotransferase class V-fold PLP-dependent enzyme [Bryobacteraceae bacterium]
MNRRTFVMTGTTLAAAKAANFESARADFPWAARQTYLNTATEHPLSIHTTRAMEEYLHALTHGPDSDRDRFENGRLMGEVKRMFAALVNAKPEEIGFTPSTQTGENLILEGLDIQAAGGNVVTNNLHYGGSLHNYENRRKAGMDVRVVKHRDYQMDMRDLEKVVDRKTKLIAIALVSNVNGYVHDVKAISDLAHAHGAYLYCDVIQAAGAVPIDVKAMGIDFLACSAYKFLMGGRFGYLYVREDLQGTALKAKLFGGRSTASGASRYEISTVSHLGCVCQHQALQYIHALKVDRIQAHAKPLIERLMKELPAAGYPSITPKGNASSIATFQMKDPAATRARLKKANVIVSPGDNLRASVSVFNNMSDVDRLIEALS